MTVVMMVYLEALRANMLTNYRSATNQSQRSISHMMYQELVFASQLIFRSRNWRKEIISLGQGIRSRNVFSTHPDKLRIQQIRSVAVLYHLLVHTKEKNTAVKTDWVSRRLGFGKKNSLMGDTMYGPRAKSCLTATQ